MPYFDSSQRTSIDRSPMMDVAGDQSNVSISVTTNARNQSIMGQEQRFHAPPEPLSDAQVYARQLLLKRHGYPLWVPEPYGYSVAYRTKGVRIGDVGYVTQDGAFETLFNIRASPQDPINRRGVPEHFEQVDISECDINHTPYYHELGGVVTSMSAQSVSFGVNFSTTQNPPSPTTADNRSRFTWRTSEGAILHLPRGASRLTCAPGLFQRQAIKHAYSWYKFANRNLHREVPNGSLYLITGTDKTNSWMVGAFSGAPPGDEVSLHLSVAVEGSTSYHYSWATASAPVSRTGPRSDEVGRVGQDDLDAIDQDDALFLCDAPGGRDQCVFVRGHRIMLNLALSASGRVQSDTQVLPVTDVRPEDVSRAASDIPFAETFQPILVGGSGGVSEDAERTGEGADDSGPVETSGTQRNYDVVLESIPKYVEAYHPSTIINNYLLQCAPSAQVAITHDDDWIALLRETDTNVLADSELISRLRESRAVEQAFGGAFVVQQLAPDGGEVSPYGTTYILPSGTNASHPSLPMTSDHNTSMAPAPAYGMTHDESPIFQVKDVASSSTELPFSRNPHFGPSTPMESDHGPPNASDPANPGGPQKRPKPRPRRLACRQCRARKIRCDGVKPVCGVCAARVDECQYDGIPPPAKRRRITDNSGSDTQDPDKVVPISMDMSPATRPPSPASH